MNTLKVCFHAFENIKILFSRKFHIQFVYSTNNILDNFITSFSILWITVKTHLKCLTATIFKILYGKTHGTINKTH